MAIKIPTPKDVLDGIVWVIAGHDEKKTKRVLLLMILSLSLGVNGLFWYQANERAKWYKARNLPYPAPAEASK